MHPITDSFNRPLHDLRISVIDRCNFRCTYCMPEEEGKSYTFLKKSQWLSFGEILRLTKLFVRLGVTKVRLTGGEPLLRPQLPELIRDLNKIPGMEDLALTTNGALLSKQAQSLKDAGLRRLTVSLDALDEKTFQQMSGRRGNLFEVLKGITTAEDAGFESIKFNVVLQRGINDHAILDLVKYFKGSGHILRFIEYMDVGNCNHWESKEVVPSREILKIINEKYPIKPLGANYFGEVAERYAFADGTGEVGFISSVSQPFCGTCTRARLSTDGKIYTCLFATKGTDLRTPLRSGATDEELITVIKNVWQKRADKYSENRALFRSLKENPQKVEMYQIGG
ncbi:MAG: GTP 3',8-cyclase MoaA [Candidatus Omnitrophica bacterium]|nr:GTP 3',8-cyclase MoaA [Candidatus Omnitrophota bacterium]